jgi:hypothetical protein
MALAVAAAAAAPATSNRVAGLTAAASHGLATSQASSDRSTEWALGQTKLAGGDGDDSRYEPMLVTDDDEQPVEVSGPSALTALVAPNLRGVMPWTEEQR